LPWIGQPQTPGNLASQLEQALWLYFKDLTHLRLQDTKDPFAHFRRDERVKAHPNIRSHLNKLCKENRYTAFDNVDAISVTKSERGHITFIAVHTLDFENLTVKT
jgi:hypothetical protein